MNTVLVVCAGNLCRSPMAQAVLTHALPRIGVQSAGLAAPRLAAPDANAVRLMRERGFDISTHRAQQLQGAMVASSDLVLVMTDRQRRVIEQVWPSSRGKVFRFAGDVDIPDPYQRGEDAFRRVLQLIDAGAAQWTDRLSRLPSDMLSRGAA
jgi:protein-tyrosine phosphatase